MNFELAKTIAAFGGFGFGIINLAITIYKDFFRKSYLSVEVEHAQIKCIEEGEFHFQLSINITAHNGDCYLKEIFIRHPKDCLYHSQTGNIIQFNCAIPFTKRDLVELSKDEFIEEVKTLFKTPLKIRGLRIDKDSIKSLTFVDFIMTKRLPDGYEDFPLNGWDLIIIYTHNKKIKVSFEWVPHVKSKTEFWL